MKQGIRTNFIIAMFCELLVSFSVFAQSSSDVKIGKQIWMTKNLDVNTFRNGEPIPEAKNKEQWVYAAKNKIPAWCYLDYDVMNGKKYGKLYNWYAVSNSRGLAPQGYHVPSESECKLLRDYLGGSDIAGKKMKSKDGWGSYKTDGKKTCPDCEDWTQSYRNQVPCHTCKNSREVRIPVETIYGNGDNSSGFSALPGGFHNPTNGGSSTSTGTYGRWWTSSEAKQFVLDAFKFFGNGTENGFTITDSEEPWGGRGEGNSVRCIKD